MDIGSFKVLENVHLKTTQNIEVNGIGLKAGETIAIFDKIQISNFNEIKERVVARGGYGNIGRVYWEATKALQFSFTQGIFSKEQFGLLNNAKIITVSEDNPILLTYDDYIESDVNSLLTPTKTPVDQIFVYDRETGQRIEYEKQGNYYNIGIPYKDVIMHYRYNYTSGATIARIGEPFLRGFLELEGKTRVKDDTSGLITTGIIRIPQLKLMSGLSMRLGTQANPVVGNFQAEGVPVDLRRNSYVMEIYFLDHDIDSDM